MKGLEVEFDYLPYEGGRVSGWITTMDTEVTEDFNTQWYYGQDAYLGRNGYDASVANVPENYVNLKGNEAPYSPNLALTIKYEHTFNLGSMGQLIPSINYHWQAEDYLTIWNADKHINDAGGYGTYGCTNFEQLMDEHMASLIFRDTSPIVLISLVTKETAGPWLI